MPCVQAEDEEEYIESFRPDLMEVVAAWARGTRFADVAKMTTIYEVGWLRPFRCSLSWALRMHVFVLDQQVMRGMRAWPR